MSKTDRVRDQLLAEMREIVRRHEDGAKTDGGRKAAAIEGEVAVTEKLVANDEHKELEATKAQLKALREQMAEHRKPSKAGKVGGTQPPLEQKKSALRFSGGIKPHKALKASIRGYEAGSIVNGLVDS